MRGDRERPDAGQARELGIEERSGEIPRRLVRRKPRDERERLRRPAQADEPERVIVELITIVRVALHLPEKINRLGEIKLARREARRGTPDKRVLRVTHEERVIDPPRFVPGRDAGERGRSLRDAGIKRKGAGAPRRKKT